MQLSKATGYLQIRERSLANGARVQDAMQVAHQNAVEQKILRPVINPMSG